MSTRGGVAPIGFCDAVMMGLATDGGLLIPAKLPDVTERLDDWRSLSYAELAFAVLSLFVGDDLGADELRAIVENSYSTFTHPQVVPIRTVGDLHIMELFHGPTLAFKDVALQFLGNVFGHILAQRNERLNIVGATSGDTGSAAIYGVRGKPNINIFIMHPHQRVSPVQERQMTTVLDDNVHNIAIEGSFDDGQQIMKSLFRDLDFKAKYALGSVNSVNWARVAAQVVYYFHGAFRLQEATGAPMIQCSVPTGNFGDIFAGWIAKRMGAPIARLLLATNENDILSRFFVAGEYSRGNVAKTLSPSMDIQIASNFERYLYYLLGGESERLCALMAGFARSGKLTVESVGRAPDADFRAGVGNTAATLAVIRELYDEAQYVADPHTAVGVSVARQLRLPDLPVLCLATAHPAKFAAAIEQALGTNPAQHPAIEALSTLPTRCQVLPAEEAAIRQFVVSALS